MKTVKDFKDAGLVFVSGDKGLRANGDDWIVEGVPTAKQLAVWDGKDVMNEFAWRTNTGVNPDFGGVIEYIHLGRGDIKTGQCDCVLFANEYVGNWRPLITKEQPKESESPLSPDFVDKPIYTQAMCDAGEFPVIGSSVEVDKCGNIYDYEVLFVSDQYFIGTDGIHEQYFHTSSIKIKPLRPVTLTDGRAYQFAVGGRELNGIYREYDKSFYSYLGDIEAVKITNIQPLTLREGR